MQPLLKSMVLLASRPFRILFVTDPEGAARIENEIVPKLVGRKTHIANIQVRIVSSFQEAEAYAAKIKLELYKSHHSGAFGMLKLFLPFMLHDHDDIVIVDTDMVFLQDPILLWDEFEKFDNDQLYAMPLHAFNNSGNMCACVALYRTKLIRAVYNRLEAMFLEALEADPSYWHEQTGKYRPKHSD